MKREMKYLTLCLLLFLPIVGAGQSKRDATLGNLISFGDKSSDIYEVNGNVYINYNIQITCLTSCRSDELPFAQIQKYFPDATVSINYSMTEPMGYATANIQSIAGTDSNMYLKSALPAINLDTAHTIENISSAFNNNSTYQDPIYGVSINGTWDQKTASSAGTLAELKSITFGTQVPVSTMFSVFTGIEQNSSSLAGVVGSTLLTNSVYNTAGYQLRPDGTLEQSAWSTGTSPYSMPQSSLINSSAATCPSAALTSHCWTTAAGNGQSGLAYF